MEYKTYGDRAVKLEKWPISSFGPSVNPSITMISARDASASENAKQFIQIAGLETSNTMSCIDLHPEVEKTKKVINFLQLTVRRRGARTD